MVRESGIEPNGVSTALGPTLPEGAVFSETALMLPDGLDVGTWANLGETLGRLYRSSGWWLCDWVNYGERSYEGDMFHQHVEACGLAVQTLKNLGWVGRQVEGSRRRDPSSTGLSISHHTEVAALDPSAQDEWLDKAQENGWTRGELRYELSSAMPNRSMQVHYRSNVIEWYTPSHIIEKVQSVLGAIDLDPCADKQKSVPAKTHLTRDDDGLSVEWAGRVYMNPPYGLEIGAWVRRLAQQYETGDVTAAIALLPARTDTEWFHVLRDYPRCFVRGRLRFSGHANSAPFPSCAFYLGDDLARFARGFAELGDTFARVC